jgi:hypothetical protein
MRAGEHEPQALVGNRSLLVCFVKFVREQFERDHRLLPPAPAPRGIDELASRHR